jgi:hypothetical protein
MPERVAVLLGAGASADAGLPLTTQLAEIIVARANDEHRDERGSLPGWVRALNFVYGSMVGYQAEDGSNPLAAVNIERLISALRLLKDAKGHEVAPFVANWKTGALGVGAARVDPSLGDRVMSAISSSLGSRFSSGRDLGDAIGAIARSATSAPHPGAFGDAETHLLEYLSDLLGAVRETAYLQPLAELARLQPGGLDILTLNYDLTVETMAQSHGIEVDRGIGSWEPGRPMQHQVRDGIIRLYKLHGSLDWELEPPGGPLDPPNIMSPERTQESGPEGAVRRFARRRRPWIVVGDREKLATDGPTLDLLHSATEAVRRATHLVVVGYSFSDAHVNAMIRDWLTSDASRTIGILDLRWRVPHGEGFPANLVRAFGYWHREERESRVVLTEGKAIDALGNALSARPLSSTETGVDVEYNVAPGHVSARVTLRGPDLHRASVNFFCQPGAEDGPRARSTSFDAYETLEELSAQRTAPPRPPGSYRPLGVPHWKTGETVTLFSEAPPPGGDLLLHFRGSRSDGVDDVYGNVRVEPDAHATEAEPGH